MRNLVPWFSCVALGASALALACSSSSNAGPAPSDGGALESSANSDGSPAGDDDGSPGAQGTVCGSAPYVTIAMTVSAASTNGPGAPIAGAKFTSPTCPGVFGVSDADGKLVGSIPKGTPFYGRFDATNYAPQLTPEQTYDADASGIDVEMLPSLFTAIISGYDATKGTIFIGAIADNGHDGGTDPCDALDGIAYSIVGHDEYVPVYYSNGTVPSAVAGTVTTASGRASFAGLALGETYTLAATKAGCEVTFVHAAGTGRAPVEANYVTLIGAYSHDVAGGQGDAAAE